jgi:hypothetical protein
MPTEIWCALIAGVVTLITTLLTLQVTMKKDRDKQRDDIKAELIKYHEKNREEIQDIRQNDLRHLQDDVTAMGANLQQKIAVIEIELGHARNDINTLSTRVERHNGVVERTSVLEEKVSVANHRILDLESKIS